MFLINTGTAIPKPFRKQNNTPTFTSKNLISECTYFENIQTTEVQKCRMLVFLSSTLNALYIETKRIFVNQNKGKIALKIFPWKNGFFYEWTFWFISFENSGKQKSKNTLRVEINQFCDG